jgi:hypothetical protein
MDARPEPAPGQQTFNFMHTNRKAAIGFIFVTLLIDVMGWGLIIPVMANLISQ